MGVLQCSRRGCDNIMCDIYVPQIGYVCNECREEFIFRMKVRDLRYDSEIHAALEEFMDTYAYHGVREFTTNNVEKFFEKHTK